MGKIIVGCDIDDTIIPFVKSLLKKYNKKYKDDISIDDLTDYNIHSFLKPKCKHIFQEFANKKLFKKIVIPREVINVLTEMNKKYELYFVTAGHPKTTRYRDKLLSRYLPWYSSGQLITCRNKGLIKLDVLIDDCITNINKNDGVGILIKKPWNIKCGYSEELTCEKFDREIINIIDEKILTV